MDELASKHNLAPIHHAPDHCLAKMHSLAQIGQHAPDHGLAKTHSLAQTGQRLIRELGS